jgi:hypothetical protein
MARAPAKMHPAAARDGVTISDYRRFPGARLLIACCLCGWEKSYHPERVIERLRQLKTGGHATPLDQIARRVAWPCPGCHRVKWRAVFAWPAGLDETEIKRLANLYRN